jgi:cobyrinic acid a,c-diamide synthase
MDKAFWFYYPENLELLSSLGAEVVYLDALSQEEVPLIHGLYMGGGFPETQAEGLARNTAFRSALKGLIDRGLPVYAECGGLIYLGRQLTYLGSTYPMLGVLGIDFGFQERPVGHGYTECEVVLPNPYFPMGKVVKGHEFHYSVPQVHWGSRPSFVFKVLKGAGIANGMDGVLKGQVLGTYIHVHALGERHWAEGLVRQAGLFKGTLCGS